MTVTLGKLRRECSHYLFFLGHTQVEAIDLPVAFGHGLVEAVDLSVAFGHHLVEDVKLPVALG